MYKIFFFFYLLFLCHKICIDVFILHDNHIMEHIYLSLFLSKYLVCLPLFWMLSLSDCLIVLLSDCVTVWLSVCLTVCLSDCLSVWLSSWLSGYLFVWLSDRLSVDCLSIFQFFSSQYFKKSLSLFKIKFNSVNIPVFLLYVRHVEAHGDLPGIHILRIPRLAWTTSTNLQLDNILLKIFCLSLSYTFFFSISDKSPYPAIPWLAWVTATNQELDSIYKYLLSLSLFSVCPSLFFFISIFHNIPYPRLACRLQLQTEVFV